MAIDGSRPRHVIAPGEPERSALYLRMRTESAELTMPYRGRSTPDAEALKLIREWIPSLPQ